MKYPKYLAFTALLLLISGCSGSFIGSGVLPGTGTELIVDQGFVNDGSKNFSYEIIDVAYQVSEEDKSIFKNRLELLLNEKLLYKENSNKVIEITFNNYNMRSGVSRAMLGVAGGIDRITTTVIIKEKDSGKILGKSRVMSKNATAWSSSNNSIEQHVYKIVSYISP